MKTTAIDLPHVINQMLCNVSANETIKKPVVLCSNFGDLEEQFRTLNKLLLVFGFEPAESVGAAVRQWRTRPFDGAANPEVKHDDLRKPKVRYEAYWVPLQMIEIMVRCCSRGKDMFAMIYRMESGGENCGFLLPMFAVKARFAQLGE